MPNKKKAAAAKGAASGQTARNAQIAATQQQLFNSRNQGGLLPPSTQQQQQSFGKVSPSAPQTELDKNIKFAKDVRLENKNYLANHAEPGVDALDDARLAANSGDQLTNLARYNTTAGTVADQAGIVAGMEGDFGKYKTEAEGLNQSDLNALAQYQTKNADMVGRLGELDWKDVKGSGTGFDAQNDALAQYKSLISPQVTAQERFLGEQSRLAAEQQERSSRDAVMADLGARGMRGSGAELTNMLGAQQLTGQNRVLADLGMNAGAVGRGMTALEGYGRVSNEMRANDDILTKFNGEQGQLARIARQTAESGLAKSSIDATTGVNQGVSDRSGVTLGKGQAIDSAKYKQKDDAQGLWDKYFGGQDTYVDKAYGRQKDVTGAGFDLTSLFTGGNRADAGLVADANKAKAGDLAAADAVKQANKKDSLLDFVWG